MFGLPPRIPRPKHIHSASLFSRGVRPTVVRSTRHVENIVIFAAISIVCHQHEMMRLPTKVTVVLDIKVKPIHHDVAKRTGAADFHPRIHLWTKGSPEKVGKLNS